MLTKTSSPADHSPKSRCFGQRRRFKFLTKMTRYGSTSSPYEKMDSDVREVKMAKKKVKKSEVQEACRDKSEAKNKMSKKKTWKLIRQATLSTCRYIGLGVAHLSPVAAYGAPDFYIDPKQWNKSFNRSSKPPPTPAPHWANTMMFSGV